MSFLAKRLEILQKNSELLIQKYFVDALFCHMQFENIIIFDDENPIMHQ